ncbi:MAG: transcriptional regulator [Anaerolineaceae bacterium]|jgi:transcriptional regulator with XRE-family HTH domain|nr:MAG: transcriptional regulator [Anaerolineaceae bacterium]
MESYKVELETIAQKLTQSRLNCGKSMKNCADAIGTTVSRYKKIESGELIPTLPELETLSYFFNVPMIALIGKQEGKQETSSAAPNPNTLFHLVEIRNSVIGTLLQIEREKKSITLKDMAARCEITRSRMKRYESGLSGIPLNDLLKIAAVLSIDLNAFFDRNSPIGIWQKSQQTLLAFLALPAEIQDFVTDRTNLPYLELAQKMKNLRPEDLEVMSEAIQLILQNLPLN